MANAILNFHFDYVTTSLIRLGDILSQRQIVPPAFFGRQIVPDDKISHFLPMRQIVPATKCPISSPATKCPTDDPTEKPLFHWHFSGDKLSQVGGGGNLTKKLLCSRYGCRKMCTVGIDLCPLHGSFFSQFATENSKRPYSKGFRKFGCLKPSKITIHF